MSGFTRIGDGEYLFTARAGSRGYPVDSAAAEAVRIGWLEEYLAANRACPNGYDVVSRDATSRGGGSWAAKTTTSRTESVADRSRRSR
jgi:hypothetical protein